MKTVSRRALRTFDNQSGRNVFYRAAIHPMTAPLTRRLIDRIAAGPPVAIYDPAGYFADLAAIYDLSAWPIEGVYVQRLEEVGQDRAGFTAQSLMALRESRAKRLFIADFDGARLAARLGPYKPSPVEIESFDSLRLDPAWLTVPERYLDPLNFVSDFLFFRDAGGLRTTVSTANYWHAHGAVATRLWCRLFDEMGVALASWEETLPGSAAGVIFDSEEIRKRFKLGPFTGSLFVHVIGAAAHDTLKYAIDLYDDSGATATATHDSNPWAAELYAGLPAPAPNERVMLWVQNCYPTPIPAGAIGLRRMGDPAFTDVGSAVSPYGTVALDIGATFPGLAWPAQIEIRADKYCCRPRYEIAYASGHRSVAHVNVERTDLEPAPDLPRATRTLGKGFLLPAPVLPVGEWNTVLLPTPMASWQDGIALTVRVYGADGTQIAEERLGARPRGGQTALDIDSLLRNAPAPAEGYGHLEIGYDFDAAPLGDGWLHALFRYRRRDSGRAAETSFGSHIFNVPALWRNEPNAYIGKPPGLSTRLHLRLIDRPGRVLCHLTYPTSGEWLPASDTDIILSDSRGAEIARQKLRIPCSGSRLIDIAALFGPAERDAAAGGGYATIRDPTCRLFGYHLFQSDGGGFALDHMFGF
jgi:hypothetical protein